MDKPFIAELEEGGYLEYGSTISGRHFRKVAGIQSIYFGSIEEIKRMQLQEMSCADEVRVYLLKKGRYFKQEGDGYRVLLPSENAEQVKRYMRTADQKLKRALLLDKNTPTDVRDDSHHMEVRLIMKRESIKNRNTL